MEYRKLGNTGLEVSVIALGCEAFVEDKARLNLKSRIQKAGIIKH